MIANVGLFDWILSVRTRVKWLMGRVRAAAAVAKAAAKNKTLGIAIGQQPGTLIATPVKSMATSRHALPMHPAKIRLGNKRCVCQSQYGLRFEGSGSVTALLLLWLVDKVYQADS